MIAQVTEKADTWFGVSNMIISVSLPKMEDGNPLLAEIMKDDHTMSHWQSTMCSALVACAVISTLDTFPKDEAEVYVTELVKNYCEKYPDDNRMNHAMEFVIGLRELEHSLSEAFGFWVLTELKRKQLKDNELVLVAPLGAVVTGLGVEWWTK